MMASQFDNHDDLMVVTCMLCGRPLGEEDDIFLLSSPYGCDLDIVCGECHVRIGPTPEREGHTGETGIVREPAFDTKVAIDDLTNEQ